MTVAILGALSVAACSGSGSSTPSILAQAGAGSMNVASGASRTLAAASTFTVSGVVADLSNPNQPLIQAGAGCGYLHIDLTSNTKIITDGNPIAVGRYVESVGSGSCATYATATTLYVAANAAGVATLISTHSASAAPTPTPGIGMTSQACLNTVTGHQWPTNCRPYAVNAPWNIALPDSPLQTTAFPAAVESGGNPGFAKLQVYGGLNNQQNDMTPIWFAKNTDPVYTSTCKSWCMAGYPTTMHMPANAVPEAGSDKHMAVIQPDGTEIDFEGAVISGSTVTGAAVAYDNLITGSGTEVTSATSGASLAAGNIRSDELQTALNTTDGYIPHVLTGNVHCVTPSYVLPFGRSDAYACTSGTSVHIGDHIQYTQTFAQIDALSGATPFEKVILRTLHRYGVAIEDTSGETNTPQGGFSVKWEDPFPYIVTSQPVPFNTIGPALGFPYNSTNGEWAGPSPEAADPNFALHLVVVNPCYARGTCTL